MIYRRPEIDLATGAAMSDTIPEVEAGSFWAGANAWFANVSAVVFFAILAMLLFCFAAIWALFFSDQGRDLLQVTHDIRPAILLYSGLSCTLGLAALFVLLLNAFAGDDPNPDRLRDSFSAALAICLCLIALSCSLIAGCSADGWASGLIIGFSVLAASALIVPLITGILYFFWQKHFASAPWFGISTALACLVPFAIFPSGIGSFLGSPLLLACVLSAWLLLITCCVVLGRRASPIRPRLTSLIIISLAYLIIRVLVIEIGVSLWLGHAPLDFVRTTGAPAAPLPTLNEAFDRWQRAQPPVKGKPDPRPQLILIASAGGGIRASYWSSLILSRLADQVPSVRQKLFASSGVSGGSLGLGLFYALLSRQDGGCVGEGRGSSLEACVHSFHQSDFVAGPLAATLAGSPGYLFLPLFPTRSSALEQGFERAWQGLSVAGNSPGKTFARPLPSLWPAGAAHPLLLLNATLAASGERAVSADVELHPWLHWRTACQLNLVKLINPPLSAAVGASARFPLITDPGWLDIRSDPGCNDLETVADGGYFDNYGAATLLDLMAGLGASNLKQVRLVVVQITSDPSPGMACLFSGLSQDRADSRAAPARNICARTPVTLPDQTVSEPTGWPRLPRPPGPFGEGAAILDSAKLPSGIWDRAPDPLDILMQSRSVTGIDLAEKLGRKPARAVDPIIISL